MVIFSPLPLGSDSVTLYETTFAFTGKCETSDICKLDEEDDFETAPDLVYVSDVFVDFVVLELLTTDEVLAELAIVDCFFLSTLRSGTGFVHSHFKALFF